VNVPAGAKRVDEGGIIGQMGEKPQLDLGVVGRK
jgi:hypothetical protein